MGIPGEDTILAHEGNVSKLNYPVLDGVDITDAGSVASAFTRALKTAPEGKKVLLVVTGGTGLIGQGLIDHVVKNSSDCAIYPLGGPSLADAGINENDLMNDSGWNWFNAGISPDGDPCDY